MDIILNSGPAEWVKAVLFNPWGLYQLAIIFAGFIVAKLVDRWVEPLMEERARKIKGNPDLLRVIVAFMRRLEWLFLIVWLWAARGLVLYYTSWPSRVWLIGLALTLASVWFAVAVLTRIIRSRSISRFVAVIAWVYIALYVTGFDDTVMTALDGAAVTAGSMRISLYSTIRVILVSVALMWVAVLIGNVVSNRIERLDDLSPAYRVLLGKLVKIALIVFAGAGALTATGIDLTALTVFSGAVGVGIGFGLQKVVSNFISGIIILSDKSIKPGDTISLGDTFGWIRELRARFVSVITRDGREYLIPNEDFITTQVVNWSFSSDYVRIDVDFGVSYDSDPHEVVRIAIETAKGIKRITNYKEPVCWMTAFGSSSLDFKLRFWITDPNNGLTNVRGQVLLALWDAFKEAGINIPFPHREVIMKTPVDVTVAQQPVKRSSKPAPSKD